MGARAAAAGCICSTRKNGTSVAVHPDPEDTAKSIGADHPGDGDAWLRLYQQYVAIREPLLQSLLTSWPPVVPGIKLVRKLGSAGELLRFARFMAMPMHRMGRELFAGPRGAADAGGERDARRRAAVGQRQRHDGLAAGDAGPGRRLPGRRRRVVVVSGALVRRAERAGALLVSGTPVAGIDVSSGRVTGVRTASGETVASARAVIADTSAPVLYRSLLPDATIPAGLRRDLDERFEWDYPTVKLNFRLSGADPVEVVRGSIGRRGPPRWDR
jgi:phytoene dehydrogenase-like protein